MIFPNLKSGSAMLFRRYLIWLVLAVTFIAVQGLLHYINSVFQAAIKSESVWSGNQKMAANELFHFVIEGDSSHYRRHIAHVENMRMYLQFRQQLMSINPDYNSIDSLAVRFVGVQDKDKLVLFFTLGKNFETLDPVFSSWAEIDRLTAQLFDTGGEMLRLRAQGRIVEANNLLSLITALDMKISELGFLYEDLLDSQLQYVLNFLLVFNILFSFILIIIGIRLDVLVQRRQRILSEKFNLLLQEFPVQIFLLDNTFTIKAVHARPSNNTSETAIELTGRSFTGLFDSGDKSALLRMLQTTLANEAGKPEKMQDSASLVVHRDGRRIQVLAKKAVDDAGLVLVMLTDITREEQAAGERLRYLQSLDASLNEIYVIDPTTFKLVYLNKGAFNNTGYTLDELAELTLFDINLDLNREDIVSLETETSLHPDSKKVIEGNHLRKDGSTYPVEMHIQFVDNSAGRQLLAVAVDISQRRQTESMLREAFQEQRVLLRETNHRIKNNLHMVSSLISLQASKITDHAAKDMLLETVNRLRALMMLHDQLFMAHTLERFDMADYIKRLVGNLVKTFKSPDISIGVDVPPVSLSSFEAIHCGLMVNEMVTNAIKHAFKEPWSGERKEITICLKQLPDNGIQLCVADNGNGFSKELDFKSGSSLGLLLLATLSRQMSGSVTADGSNGAIFTVTFKKGTSTDG
jgi:PAS domain S-box-containing protein